MRVFDPGEHAKPTNLVPSRIGEVWEWPDGEVELVIGKPLLHACYASQDEVLHPTVSLMTGQLSGRYEQHHKRWEEDRSERFGVRIA